MFFSIRRKQILMFFIKKVLFYGDVLYSHKVHHNRVTNASFIDNNIRDEWLNVSLQILQVLWKTYDHKWLSIEFYFYCCFSCVSNTSRALTLVLQLAYLCCYLTQPAVQLQGKNKLFERQETYILPIFSNLQSSRCYVRN